MRETRQATRIELQIARVRARAPSETDDWSATIPEPEIRINYEALRGWLDNYRRTAPPAPAHLCAHCDDWPRAEAPCRPWHPLLGLLCWHCRARIFITAERIVRRTGHDFAATLDDMLRVLYLTEESN